MISLSASSQQPTPVIKVTRDGTKKTAVKVEDVSIRYRTAYEKVPTFKTALVRFGRGERAVKEVQALHHVSFDIPDHASVGIIGANGAGKSTLMRAIAGVLPPNQGRIEVRGRISSLLALGVGFNGQLSGRENIELGALAQGFSPAEVAARANEIAAFAEVEEFIDMPMRAYSSGMYQRLAFSVGVHMDPDILLIDEALSAGDARFREKASAKMTELMQSARAMFLVSHSLGAIKEQCDEAIWLHKGRLMMHASPDECVEAYTKFLEVGENAFTMEEL